jgi:hypothetical protein
MSHISAVLKGNSLNGKRSHLHKQWPAFLLVLILSLFTTKIYASDYYVNCSSTSPGSGSETSPFNSLTSLSEIHFQGGDRIYFARGTTCSETSIFAPQGSGDATNGPIIINAYTPQGSTATALPIISATGSSAPNAAMKLQNQQYWEVNNLELDGGVTYGLYVAVNAV